MIVGEITVLRPTAPGVAPGTALPAGPAGPSGPAGPAGPPGSAGPAGAAGPLGPAGPPTTLLIGDVSASAPGSVPAVNISGQAPNQILGFVLPRGIQGPQGDQGPQGIQGVQGDRGPQGLQGPQGIQGVQGPQGAGVSIKGSVNDPSQLPTSGNSQGDTYIVTTSGTGYTAGDGYTYAGTGFTNVGQVRGPTGPQGPTGATGPQGPQGPTGPTGATGPMPTGAVLYNAAQTIPLAQAQQLETNLLQAGLGFAIVSDGTANTPSPQAAVDLAYTLGASVVLRSAIQTLTTALMMRPGVKVRGVLGGGLKYAGGTIVEFNTYAAHSASLEDCVIDGGWDGVAATDNSLAINNSVANDTVIRGCTLQNIKGSAIYQSGTTRFVIENNTFNKVGCCGVAPTNGSVFAHYGVIRRNFFYDVRQHAVLAVKASEIDVVENNILDLGPIPGLVVALSGPANNTTITTQGSGGSPLFTNARVGAFLVCNGGLEYLITAVVNQNTITAVLTSGTYPGTVNTASAIIGCGDQINMQSGYGNRICRNVVKGSATAGILVWDDSVNGNVASVIEGNRVEYAGNAGICTQATGVSTYETVIRNNFVRNAGQGGAASAAGWNVGIFAYGGPGRTSILGNTIVDDQSTATTQYPIAVDGNPAGNAIVCGNSWFGMPNPSVRGGVISVALGSGWGNQAGPSNIVWSEGGISFNIVSGGSGQAASPAITINRAAVKSPGSAMSIALVQDPAVTLTPYVGYALAESETTLTLQVGSLTPVAGRTYNVFIKH